MPNNIAMDWKSWCSAARAGASVWQEKDARHREIDARIARCRRERLPTLALCELVDRDDPVPEGLRDLTWLRGLYISGAHRRIGDCRDQSLEPLRNLGALEFLDCDLPGVKTLEPLCNLRSLTRLNCSGMEVDDLEPLRELAALVELNCSGTFIESLEPLRELAALVELNCSGTFIESLEPLRELSALERLDCSTTFIESLEPLRGLDVLRKVDCSCVPGEPRLVTAP